MDQLFSLFFSTIRDRSVSLSDRQRIMVEQFDKRSVTNSEDFLKASSWQINIDFSQLMSDRLRSENDMLKNKTARI